MPCTSRQMLTTSANRVKTHAVTTRSAPCGTLIW